MGSCWQAEAPSNIALIKYMGKKPGQSSNIPTNGSLSYTLDHLRTRVEISKSVDGNDSWELLEAPDIHPFALSAKGQERFLKHFSFLKSQFSIAGNYLVRSGSNFPADCGLASSASSFAALTKATFELGKEFGADISQDLLSSLSRQGSGSSCRSMFSPWALWKAELAEPISCGYEKLLHQAVIVGSEKKLVSSSEAHQRVLSSALFDGRVDRANGRLEELITALQTRSWQRAFSITWADFWDMHALFETSEQPFGYMNSGSMEVLESVRQCWRRYGDGPITTMDAGANVHLLYREDQREMAKRLAGESFSQYSLIISPELR